MLCRFCTFLRRGMRPSSPSGTQFLAQTTKIAQRKGAFRRTPLHLSLDRSSLVHLRDLPPVRSADLGINPGARAVKVRSVPAQAAGPGFPRQHGRCAEGAAYQPNTPPGNAPSTALQRIQLAQALLLLMLARAFIVLVELRLGLLLAIRIRRLRCRRLRLPSRLVDHVRRRCRSLRRG